ncbi:MAG: hypothetical protein JSW58_09795 [Candidatus Latescibacterota bacterium]|nr:MAG: hypothetical protein JSW58_09795 [Candidatus Latescibacterota bacterium]
MQSMRFSVPMVFLLVCAGAMALLSSCEEDCPVCPESNGTTQNPVGWFAQTAPNEESYFGLHVFNANTAIAVGSNGFIIRTSDGGDNWSVVTSGSTNRLHRVSFVGNTGWTVGLNSVILKTTDAGLTWMPQDAGVTTHFRSVHFVDENTGWVVASPWGTPNMEGYVMKTIDGGDSWAIQLEEPSNAVFFVDADSGCVGTSGGVYRTTNGGGMWQFVDMGAPRAINQIFFVNTLTGWAVCQEGFMAKTTDGGRTWVQQQYGTDRNVSDVFFLDSNRGWYVTGDPATIATTIDGGATWTFQTCPITSAVRDVMFANENVGWIVGYYGTILRTFTGGRN